MTVAIHAVSSRRLPFVISTIRKLDRLTFPGDKPVEEDGCLWWLATGADRQAVGFLCLETGRRTMMVRRYGVIASHRGLGLGRRFLKTAERAARRRGKLAVVSYTVPGNAGSMNAMIAAGYRTFVPKAKHYGDDVVYWIRRL